MQISHTKLFTLCSTSFASRMERSADWPRKTVGNNDFTESGAVIIGAGFSGKLVRGRKKNIRYLSDTDYFYLTPFTQECALRSS